MSLIERVPAILLRPKQTWPVIAAEPADVATIYSRYVVILAAIPAIAGFIGWTLIGAGAFGVSFTMPIATGLLHGRRLRALARRRLRAGADRQRARADLRRQQGV